tara:strand:+ start:2039 stop:2644 length:606 start_codon:yes stop_codon:yes gene_type:complete
MSTLIIPNGQYKNGTAQATAIQGMEQAPEPQNPNGRSGWLFSKVVAGTAKFNYFFYGQGSLPITLADIKNIYANISNDNYTGMSTNPYLVVYTKPTGVGDFSWYHSAIKYLIPSTFNVQSGEMITINSHSTNSVNHGYRQCWANNMIIEGEALQTEEILYISIHSDSAAAVGTEILVSDVGFSINHRHHKIDRHIKLISSD